MTESEAIKRVKEFGLHHAIGDLPYSTLTVKAFEMAIESLREIQQYRAIGTVEECREARERQKAKKPEKHGTTRQGLDNDGHSISRQEDCYICPNCESFLGYVIDCKDENYQDDYCRNCGQAIDWTDTP